MSYSVRQGRDVPILTTGVCILCTIIFLQLQSATGWAQTARWGMYPETVIYEGKSWSLLTSAFVHQELLHLVFNLYWLWILGGAFERTFGSLRWLAFVLFTAWVSSGIQLLSGSAGIGFSGVGYAFFGFAWVSKSIYPEFTRIVDNRTIRLFVGWGILCFVLTATGQMNIGNFAHLGGTLVGAAIAGIVVIPKARIPLLIGVLALLACSILPIFWNPLSPVWVGLKATTAMTEKDYPTALKLLQRSMALDQSAYGRKFAYYNMAEIYGFQGKADEYRKALEGLEVVDPEGKRHVQDAYGTPEEVARRRKD